MYKEQFLKGLSDAVGADANVRKALEAAYAEGAATARIAPTAAMRPISQIYAVTDANCAVQAAIHNVHDDKIVVTIEELGSVRMYYFFTVNQVENTDYLYEQCKAERLDVFKAIVEATLEVKRLLD